MAASKPKRLAVVSSKGGVGKTTIALALASQWAQHLGQVLVWDGNAQGRGSAITWLDETSDNIEGLLWKGGSLADAREVLSEITVPVIIDTAPAILDQDLADIAAVADLLLIPGSIDEDDTIVQTARSLDVLAPGVPYVAVLTRTPTVTLASAEGANIIRQLEAVNVPVAGSVRLTRALATARRRGRLPVEIAGAMADPVADDITKLFYAILGRLEVATNGRS